MKDDFLTPAERVKLNEVKRALDHWYKTCLAMCDTCEGCPYDKRLHCFELEANIQRLRKAYKEIVDRKPLTSL